VRDVDEFPLVMAFDRPDQRGIPRPAARGLFCCMRTDGALCEHCPSHPNQKEG
jgi:hypothetical protein